MIGHVCIGRDWEECCFIYGSLNSKIVKKLRYSAKIAPPHFYQHFDTNNYLLGRSLNWHEIIQVGMWLD